MIKLSKAQQDALAKQEEHDRQQAFEAGFAKAARDLGITDEKDFNVLYDLGVKKLAAEQASRKA